jgi:outer membrane protein OmpA-like peptidoglycan-associated protein
MHSVNAQESNPFKLVNSVYDEQSPVISPDGKVLYLTIANHPQNIGGKKDPGDIWVSLNLNGVWQAPIHGGTEINNDSYNAAIGFNQDGSKLFLAGHYSKKGVVSTQGISFSEKTSGGWSIPKNINITYFLNKSDFSAAINDDQSILVFSAESYTTIGGEDIYVSTIQNGKWSEPVNVGKQINTARQEVNPWLSADTKMLYFASNGWQGFGSFDIFKSERLDDTWKNWSTPINLGSAINSEARELFYRNINGKTLFTTTRDSDGYGDIRQQLDANKPLVVDTLRKIVEQKYVPTSSKFVSISGSVTTVKGGNGLAAKLIFKTDSSFVVNSTISGKYQIQIPTTRTYTIEVQKKGFVNVVERLDLNSMKLNSLQMNFRLQPIEVGTVVNLKSVLFNTGTTTLLVESYPELDAVVDFLNENTKVEIQLEGHTDNRGDAKKNLTLSQERVARIKSYLVSKGISGKRVKGKGFGGTKPIATGDSEESRKLNRRVEFLIVKS